MHRCFPSVIAPSLAALSPSVIVEVGAGSGRTTRRLLDAEEAANATVHAVDPQLQVDDELVASHAPRLVLHEARGLAVLSRVPDVDLVLLDGDPNYWTVRSELEATARVARADEHPPPPVIVHQVHWPFGRRDGYYDLDAVPPAHRHACSAGALRLENADPVEVGLRLAPFVARSQFGPANGVLTAAEDFIAADGEPWQLVDIPGHHGCAVLASASAIERLPALRALLDMLGSAPALRATARRAEAGRIDALIALEERSAAPGNDRSADRAAAVDEAEVAEPSSVTLDLAESAAAVEPAAAQPVEDGADVGIEDEDPAGLQVATAGLIDLVARAARAEASREAAESRVDELRAAVTELERRRDESATARADDLRATIEATVRLEQATQQLDVVRAAQATDAEHLRDTREALAATEAARDELTDELRVARARIAHLEEAIEATRRDAKVAARENAALEAALAARRERDEQLTSLVAAAAGSRSWRVSHRIARFGRAVLLRPARSDASALGRAADLLERPLIEANTGPADRSDATDTASEPITERTSVRQ